MGVPEAGEDQPEVIKPMIKSFARDRDAEAAGVGEVGEPLPPGLILLAEDHLLLRPVNGAPSLYAAPQRAPYVAAEIGMAPGQFLKHADHPYPRRGFQDRHDLGVPIRRKRVRTPPARRRLLLRRRARNGLQPIGGGGREPGLGRRGLRRMRLPIIHVEPHLAVGNVATRQPVDTHPKKNQQVALAGPDRQTARDARPPMGVVLQSGYSLPPNHPHRRSHPD